MQLVFKGEEVALDLQTQVAEGGCSDEDVYLLLWSHLLFLPQERREKACYWGGMTGSQNIDFELCQVEVHSNSAILSMNSWQDNNKFNYKLF